MLKIPEATIRSNETISKEGVIWRVRESVGKKRPLNEMWYIPGSFEQYRSQIWEALRAVAESGNGGGFGAVDDSWSLYLDGVLGDTPDQVIVENSSGGSTKYYRADVSFTDDNEVEFNNISEVDLTLRVQAKNEMRLMESKARESDQKRKLFVESYDETEVTLIAETKTASVKVAQIADVKNLNNRIYTKPVLREAVNDAKTRIAEKGGLLMDSRHRKVEGDQFDLRECVAVINEIEFDESSGILSLPKITFVDNQAGNDIWKLFEAGASLQVSQRAYGASHIDTDDDTGAKVEIIDFLVIDGFDFLQQGDAAVEEADVTPGTDESKDKGKSDESDKSSKGKKLDESDNPKPDDKGKDSDPTADEEAKKKLDERGKQDQGRGSDMRDKDETKLTPELEKLIENEVKSKVESLQKDLDDNTTLLSQFKKAETFDKFSETATKMIDTRLGTMPRFSETQKMAIKTTFDLPGLYESKFKDVESHNIETELEPILKARVQAADKVAASTKLVEMGYKDELFDLDKFPNTNGITHTRIVKEHLPGEEQRRQISDAAWKTIMAKRSSDEWVMPEDHAHMAVLDKVMEGFFEANYHHFKALNEADGNVIQTDISTRIATINAIVIPIAWRLHTAFQVCMLGTMDRRIEDIQVEKLSPTNLPPGELDVAADFDRLEVPEGEDIPLAGPIWPNVQIHATRQALRSRITPDVVATAKGTTVDPFVSSVNAIAMSVVNAIDKRLWWLHIIEPMMRGLVRISAFQTATRVGQTNEWQAINNNKQYAWLPYEYVYRRDTNTNAMSARLVPTSPKADVSASGVVTQTSAENPDLTDAVQGVVVQTDASPAVPLIFGDDYRINFPDGSVTLTADGESKRAGNNIQLMYSYCPYVPVWSIIPPPNVDFRNHLVNLRRRIGQAGIVVREQNYNPNCIGLHIDIENMMTQGPYFTNLGATPAEQLTAMNEIMNYSGYDPVKSTALPRSFIPVFEKMSVYHLVHTSWAMEPTEMNERTADKYIIGQQYTGNKMVVPEQGMPVAIADLNTILQ